MATGQDGHWKSVTGSVDTVRAQLAADAVNLEDAMITYDGTNIVAIYRVG